MCAKILALCAHFGYAEGKTFYGGKPMRPTEASENGGQTRDINEAHGLYPFPTHPRTLFLPLAEV
jgi:hypothetical protein